jgi:hypothetical protein
MKKSTALASASLALLLALPAASSAQTFTNSPQDGRLTTQTLAAGETVCFFFAAVGGRSYSVTVAQPAIFTSTFTVAVAQGGNCPGLPDMGGLVETAGIEPSFYSVRRVSFVAPATNFVITTVVNTGATASTIVFNASDTTQFSPVWSTNGTYDTFYSFMNTTNVTCAGTLTLRNTAGTLITTNAFTVASGATLSTNTVSMGTTRNLTGTARLSHTCPPGAILTEAAVANFTISPTPYFQFVHFEPTRESTH